MKFFEMAFQIHTAMSGNMNTYAVQSTRALSNLRMESARLKKQYSTLETELQSAQSSMRVVGSTIREITQAHQTGTMSTAQYISQMRGLRSSYSSASSEADRLTHSIREVMEAQKLNQKAMGKMQAKENFMQAKGKMTMAYGDMVASFSMAREIASPLTDSIQTAIKFESAMADVKKVVDFDTPEQFKEMNNDIIALTQRLPMAAEDIAKIVAAGGQSGIAREDLMSFAESAAKMGVAFDVTAEQAGDMMAKWRTAFKMNQTDVVALADKINYLGNTTAAAAPLISDVVTRIGPLGDVGGVASGEIAALGASMVGVGIPSDVAATGIKNMILSMVAGESATKSQKKAFASLGMETSEVAKRMQVDAKGAILDVLNAIQGLNKEEQASTLKELFGSESLSAIAPLLSNLDNLKDNLNKVGDASKYAGSMEGEYAARSATTENQLQLLKNSFEAISISIGSTFLPVVNDGAKDLSEYAGVVGDIAAEHPELAQGAVLAAGAIGGMIVVGQGVALLTSSYQALAGAVTFAKDSQIAAAIASKAHAASTALMSGAAKAAAAGQWLLNAALTANPIGVAVMAVAALAGALVYLYNNSETAREIIDSVFNGISTVISTVMTVVSGVISSACVAIPAFFQGAGDAMQNILSTASEGVMNIVGNMVDWVTEKLAMLREAASHPIDFAVNIVKSIVGGGGEIGSNAQGGIYQKGAFLTTFAEEGPEAAIPLDGSKRAKDLWYTAGSIMGLVPDNMSKKMKVGMLQGGDIPELTQTQIDVATNIQQPDKMTGIMDIASNFMDMVAPSMPTASMDILPRMGEVKTPNIPTGIMDIASNFMDMVAPSIPTVDMDILPNIGEADIPEQINYWSMLDDLPADSNTTNNHTENKSVNQPINISIPVTVNGSADRQAISDIQSGIEATVRRVLKDIESHQRRVSFA